MLSKEEIEVLKKLFEEVIQTREKSDIRLKINKQVAEYLLSCINSLEQLESDKQKLIEKLEEDIKFFEKTIEESNVLLVKECYRNKLEYAQEILEILKGEKE